ncbi:helix-turn-helix domain-containing protein, partial [Escherichia sp. TWPC-MK]
QSEYIQINVVEILNQLKSGETVEYQQAYIGDKQQLFSRLMFHRLTEAQLQKCLKKIAEKERAKNKTYTYIHQSRGRKSKLSLEEMLFVTLKYFRQYPTMKEIAFEYNVAESTIHRTITWVEDILIRS